MPQDGWQLILSQFAASQIGSQVWQTQVVMAISPVFLKFDHFNAKELKKKKKSV